MTTFCGSGEVEKLGAPVSGQRVISWTEKETGPAKAKTGWARVAHINS